MIMTDSLKTSNQVLEWHWIMHPCSLLTCVLTFQSLRQSSSYYKKQNSLSSIHDLHPFDKTKSSSRWIFKKCIKTNIHIEVNRLTGRGGAFLEWDPNSTLRSTRQAGGLTLTGPAFEDKFLKLWQLIGCLISMCFEHMWTVRIRNYYHDILPYLLKEKGGEKKLNHPSSNY